MSSSSSNTIAQDAVPRLRALLGQDVVLLPIEPGKKSPAIKSWQTTRIEKMSDAAYLGRLRKGSIGVLLGEPSNGLCSIDIDHDEDVETFVGLNPKLAKTLQSRGARGRNFWIRVEGNYPDLTSVTFEGEMDEAGKPKKWGEWRSTGGQTVIHGKHPSGCEYQILNESPPVEIAFGSIAWPAGLNLAWDFGLYQELVRKQGQPFSKHPRTGVVKLNECFFVAKFAVENVILHEPAERAFYNYADDRGLWQRETVDSVKRRLAEDLKVYADSQGEGDIERKRNNSLANGLADLLRGQTEKCEIFNQRKNRIHVANGVVHLDTNPPELREFSPSYYSRNQCPIELVEGADCPRFKNELLATALDADDISLFQRWCGSLLLTGNSAQRIMLLTGTAGGGKSTLAEIVENIIGAKNVTELRTEFLGERFELFRFLGKTVLTGQDVPAEFLMRKGSSVLKKLVGGDLLSPEGKGSNGNFDMRGDFNVVITCNSRLRVRLDGDDDAWRRRLMIINFSRKKPDKRISEFGSLLVKEEGRGILVWMIRGAITHLNELKQHGDFVLTKAQLDRTEILLAESDSVREFVRRCLKPSTAGRSVTVEELVRGYSTFCELQDWHAVAPTLVEKQLSDLIPDIHGIHKRNDIKSNEGIQRGFKGIECDVTEL